MANNFGSTNPVITKYLDLEGLQAFWLKAKDYIDDQDSALASVIKTKINSNDAAVRSYIESLTVNGVTVSSNKTADDLGTELDVTIAGEHIMVDGEAADKVNIPVYGTEGYQAVDADYTGYTVKDAFTNIDARLDGLENELSEGVVNSLEVTATHGTYGGGSPEPEKEWVKVSEFAKSTGDLTINVDDTAINTQFKSIDEELAELAANAGVTNIAVFDNFMDHDGATADNQNLVSIVLQGTKAQQFGEKPADWEGTDEDWNAYKAKFGAKSRGDILITLDESVLDERLDGIDTTVAAEVADRTEDVMNLAGGSYTPAAGTTAGVWSADVTYKNITAISTRLDEIDENLVTTITAVDTNAEGMPNWVNFTKTDSAADGGDNAVTLTVDETKLGEYIDQNETNWSNLAPTAPTVEGQTTKTLTVNGHTLVSVTPGSGTHPQVSVTGTNVTLTTEDIYRPGADGDQLEEVLKDYDEAIAALASATHFRGVYASLSAAYAAIGDSLDYGDVVIIQGTGDAASDNDGSKEYIYGVDPNEAGHVYNEANWIELGDTTAEAQRLTKVENWIDNNIISTTDIDDLKTDAAAATGSAWQKPTFTWDGI